MHAFVSRYPEEPQWHPAGQWDRHVLPSEVRDWLLDTGSLTRRLLAASGGDFRVQVWRQDWALPLPGERRRLLLQARQYALLREVSLNCGGAPWVFARSVLPATTLTGKLYHLRHFGDSSLGELLFTSRGIRRDDFEVCRIAPRHQLVPASMQGATTLWGRRSRFWLQDRPLLVCEFFLPGHRLGNDAANTPKTL